MIVCRSGNDGDGPEPTLARGARRVTGAALDGEVVGADQHRAPVDASGARDEVGGQYRAEPALLVVVGEPGERADLGEAAWVGQAVDPLPHGEPARGVLPRHLLQAAHGLRRPPAFKRNALVTDIEWMRQVTDLFGWMTPGETKTFPLAQLD